MVFHTEKKEKTKRKKEDRKLKGNTVKERSKKWKKDCVICSVTTQIQTVCGHKCEGPIL